MDNGGVTLRSAGLIDNPAGMRLRETVFPPNAFNGLPVCIPKASSADEFGVPRSLSRVLALILLNGRHGHSQYQGRNGEKRTFRI
jgi:hypothetical protein